MTLTRDGDSQTRQTTGVAEFAGDPCPGGPCAVGVSYQLDHVDDFSFSDFGGFASVEIKNIAASGASEPGAALVDATGAGALPPSSLFNTGSGKRSNQVLGGEVSSDSAAFTGTNGAPLGVLVDWTNHACALSGSAPGLPGGRRHRGGREPHRHDRQRAADGERGRQGPDRGVHVGRGHGRHARRQRELGPGGQHRAVQLAAGLAHGGGRRR